jgi:hypothetical protein
MKNYIFCLCSIPFPCFELVRHKNTSSFSSNFSSNIFSDFSPAQLTFFPRLSEPFSPPLHVLESEKSSRACSKACLILCFYQNITQSPLIHMNLVSPQILCVCLSGKHIFSATQTRKKFMLLSCNYKISSHENVRDSNPVFVL